jgi:hypothetical protein
MFNLGGAWHMYLHQNYMSEAGHRRSDIYREWDGRRVLVASDVESHHYYPGPDCLVWETRSGPDHIIAAACGDREPIIVVKDDYRRWTMKHGRIEDEDHVDGRVKVAAWIDAADIAAASARQPMFSGKWSLASARTDPALVPVQSEAQ